MITLWNKKETFEVGCLVYCTLGTRGFSRVRREVSVLAEGRHIFGRRPKPPEKTSGTGHYKDLTETGNRASKISGTRGRFIGQIASKGV